MKKSILFLILLFLFLFHTQAQKSPPFHPFKGFHIGITGQTEYIQKCSFGYLTGSDPAPKPRWTYGWETGIELSYHFAKYFGVSIGANLGTIESYACRIDFSNFPDQRLVLGSVFSWPAATTIIFPIKLEFHYPIRKNLFFTAETGVWIEGIITRLVYGKDFIIGIQRDFLMDDHYDPETNIYYTKPYYSDFGMQNFSKIKCNLLLGVGLSYQLPYGDLIRFSTGVSVSFKPLIEGYYRYYLTDSYGTFSVKNDFIYTQLSYIHTFKFLKAKKYVKKHGHPHFRESGKESNFPL